MKILIAEDNPLSFLLLRKYLEAWGHEVLGAQDGAQAWTLFQQRPCSLVITDWMMPGLDGLELIRRIREASALDYVYVILLTSKSEKEDLVAGMEAGADDFVLKPFDQDELRVRVRAGERILQLEAHLAQRNRALEMANTAISLANQRMKRDLEAAARIQKAYLPARLPEVPGVQFAWRFQPCEELAGDTLNILPLGPRHVGLYVLDVSGHGVASALLSVTLSRLLSQRQGPEALLVEDRGRASPPGPRAPAEVARRLNQRFPYDPSVRQYFTLLYGLLNLETRQFRYVSAGHPGPLRVPRQGPPSAAAGTPPALGVFEHAQYTEGLLDLEPGDRLYLYSDGVVETTDPQGRLFGLQPCLEVLCQGRQVSLADSLAVLLRTLETWRAGERPRDDVSLVAVELAAERS